jgi:hypothetical protein
MKLFTRHNPAVLLRVCLLPVMDPGAMHIRLTTLLEHSEKGMESAYEAFPPRLSSAFSCIRRVLEFFPTN